MNNKDIFRAWKESDYYESLSEEQRALLPDDLVGEVLTPEELSAIHGGLLAESVTDDDGYAICCSFPNESTKYQHQSIRLRDTHDTPHLLWPMLRREPFSQTLPWKRA